MDKMKIKYRAAGVALNRNKVLLYRSEGLNYWSLPGGRIDYGETSRDALIREVYEEIETEIKTGRLLWIIENFYKKEGKFIHELGVYYLMEFPDDSPLYLEEGNIYGHENKRKLIFRWHDIDRLGELELYPAYIKEGLHYIPHQIEHLVCGLD